MKCYHIWKKKIPRIIGDEEPPNRIKLRSKTNEGREANICRQSLNKTAMILKILLCVTTIVSSAIIHCDKYSVYHCQKRTVFKENAIKRLQN